MATTSIILANGDRLEVDASPDQVVKDLENASRSSAGTLARLTLANGAGEVAVNAAHVVIVREGGT